MVLGAKRIYALRPTIPKVKLGIRSQDGEEMYFRCPYNRKLHTLFMVYCEEKNLDNTYNVTFFHDGIRIDSSSTPAQLGLEDGDYIDAMVEAAAS